VRDAPSRRQGSAGPRVRGSGGKLGPVEIRIEGFDLPGRACAASGDFPGYKNIHVGVQRSSKRDQLLGLTAGDAPVAVWSLDCEAGATPTGVDFKGPYIQGRPGERFIYLSWGTVDHGGVFELFRRAKLWLDAIDTDVVDAALRSQLLVARLRLTDAKGHPVCAGVRPPRVEWSVG
jgi:hypothetical protein